MLATSYASQTAKNAASCRARRMPFSTAMPMEQRRMATSASISTLETGVIASVSLFIAGLFISSLSLVGLAVLLISLILTGLTRLVGLESLVGLNTEPAAETIQGE